MPSSCEASTKEFSLKKSFSYVHEDLKVRPRNDNPVALYTKQMEVRRIFAETKNSEVKKAVKQRLETYHTMKLLVCDAAAKKNEKLLLDVLVPYAEALAGTNLICQMATHHDDKDASESERKENSAPAVRGQHFGGFYSMNPSLGAIIRWIIEQDFFAVVPSLEQLKIFEQNVHHCHGTTEEKPLHLYQQFGGSTGSILSHFVVDVQGRWTRNDLLVLRKLIKAGAQVSTDALCYALMVSNANEAVKIFAWKNTDLRRFSPKNQFPIPDALLVALNTRTSAIPDLLRYGGIQMRIAQDSWHTETKEGRKKYTCCLSTRDAIVLFRQFCTVLYLCDECQEKHSLKNEPLSAKGIFRMNHRASLTPRELIDDNIVAPASTFPEALRSFLLFQDNKFDDAEFLTIMRAGAS